MKIHQQAMLKNQTQFIIYFLSNNQPDALILGFLFLGRSADCYGLDVCYVSVVLAVVAVGPVFC
jgi:hypothetical protein